MSDVTDSNRLYYRLPEDEGSPSDGAAPHETGSPDEYVLPDDSGIDNEVSHGTVTGVDSLAPVPGNEAGIYEYVEADGEEEENEEDVEKEEDPAEGKGPDDLPKPHAFLLMVRSLLTPVHGWKAIRRADLRPEVFASECFYPLTALASVSEFGQLIYGADIGISSLVISALMVFISFFLGYFLVLFVGRIVLRDGRNVLDSDFGKVFVMDALSSLALFYSLIQFLPMLEPVLVFLPLWTIYAVCRGVRFLRIPRESETLASCLLSLLVVGMPLLTGWVFSLVIPFTI